MRRGTEVAAGVVLVLACAALAEVAATAPATRASTAEIKGKIAGGGKVVRVAAVDREWADVLKTSAKNPKEKFFYEGTLAAEKDGTGFVVKGLLAGRSYDLVVWTEDGEKRRTRWEGVNMEYHRDIERSSEATDEDKKWLADFVKEMPSFYDKCRIVHLAADHKHATMLVELARTRDFHSDKGGEVIYRAELWYFENLFGGWAKDKNTEKVVARVRGKAEAFEQGWQFLPALGNITPSDAAVEIKLPEKSDASNGLVNGVADLTGKK